MSQQSAAKINPSPNSEFYSRAAEPREFQPAQDYSDEIDLLELIKAVLRTWKVWLIAVFLVSAAYGGFKVLELLEAQAAASYSKTISLAFKGADKGEYPSGATFRIQDIISPAVLESVYRQQGLQSLGISVAEFQDLISVEPYTPFYREIIAKYDALLGAGNLQAERIQALQDQKARELNKALSSNVILEFDAAETDLTVRQIADIMQAIPEEWARQAITDKGVLKTDIDLVSAQTLDDSLFSGVDYVVLSDLFADKIDALRSNIEKVKNLEGAATVKDPQTGWSLSDLENNLRDLEIYTIDELMSPIRSLGLSRNPRLAAFYYEEKQQVLEEELALLEEESALVKSAYDAYSDEKSAINTQEVRGEPGLAGYSVMPQLGGEVIDKLMQVAGEDSVEEYRQLLNNRWLETNMELAQTKSDLRSTQRLIAAVKGQGSDGLTDDLRDEYLQRAETKLPQILEQLRNYYNINWRIYEQISRDRVGSVGYLYQDAHQGVLRAASGFDLKRTALIYIALMALTTFIVVPVVMIRNALKDRARQEQQAKTSLAVNSTQA